MTRKDFIVVKSSGDPSRFDQLKEEAITMAMATGSIGATVSQAQFNGDTTNEIASITVERA